MKEADKEKIETINQNVRESLQLRLLSDTLLPDDAPILTDDGYICRCISGKCEVMIDFTLYQLCANKVCIIFPGHTIQQMNGKSADFRLNYLKIKKHRLNEILFQIPPEFIGYLTQRPVFLLTDPQELEENDAFFKEADFVYNQPANFCKEMITRNLIQNHYLQVYNDIYLLMQEKKHLRTRKDELMEKFMTLLATHYACYHEVKYYADQLCITPKYLSIITKACNGRSAKECIDDYLITAIKLRLRTSSTDIKSIANELNFGSQTFMSKYFRTRVGISPKEWRKKQERKSRE
jgi:AraC family transcriptional activator of pobA